MLSVYLLDHLADVFYGFSLISLALGGFLTRMNTACQINAVLVIGWSSSPLCTRLKHVWESRCTRGDRLDLAGWKSYALCRCAATRCNRHTEYDIPIEEVVSQSHHSTEIDVRLSHSGLHSFISSARNLAHRSARCQSVLDFSPRGTPASFGRASPIRSEGRCATELARCGLRGLQSLFFAM